MKFEKIEKILYNEVDSNNMKANIIYTASATRYE